MNAQAQQPSLFYEGFEDAAKQVIAVCGGPKVVGVALWPTKTPDAARTRMLDCLNPKEPDKFSQEEVIALARIGRNAGCHAIAEWFNASSGYAPPVVVDPEDERAELQRAFVDAVNRVERLAKTIKVTAR